MPPPNPPQPSAEPFATVAIVATAEPLRHHRRVDGVDHMLVYRPAHSPLMPRRPRRFRMYDRARAGVLPPKAGAVTHEHEGALDHDSFVLELWLSRHTYRHRG